MVWISSFLAHHSEGKNEGYEEVRQVEEVRDLKLRPELAGDISGEEHDQTNNNRGGVRGLDVEGVRGGNVEGVRGGNVEGGKGRECRGG